jgi:hypothetical protein
MFLTEIVRYYDTKSNPMQSTFLVLGVSYAGVQREQLVSSLRMSESK